MKENTFKSLGWEMVSKAGMLPEYAIAEGVTAWNILASNGKYRIPKTVSVSSTVGSREPVFCGILEGKRDLKEIMRMLGIKKKQTWRP